MDVAHCYLDGNADAVEFCPHGAFRNVLAASTYTLQEGKQPSRSGSISLFDVDAYNHRLELLHRVETAGIFDIKWNPVGDNSSPLLAQSDADGFLRIYGLECGADGLTAAGAFLRESGSLCVSSHMCLCLDWHPSATSVSVGHSDGSVSIISLSDSHLRVQEQWKAHEFELWTTSFDIQRPYLLYTGSDDCKFICWDLRTSPSAPAFQNSKAHKMGVCCIVKNPNDLHALLTGSYDEHLRIWDVRAISKPVNEASICLGGGVWRMKYHPFVSGLVLAACMHNGFAIVRINDGNAEVTETYSKHGSLAYGADWQIGRSESKDEGKNNLVATCSFYDRLLRVWISESAGTFC
ncbi:hypothetical protein Nepgr_003108 [Nepenthes gracilis]|uniref:methylated diphthine methylhydrolase n=1 Tax=Nepenthes gracilis TaxID=150966 RepID=A0AAD3RYW8_NEPGR|nr:hypothetical protein Nepgr_003108 [Nepenthes gracilis]